MKALRMLFSGVLMAASAVALGQSDGQKSFDQMKTLAGAWQGKVTTTPTEGMMKMQGMVLNVSLRMTSLRQRADA